MNAKRRKFKDDEHDLLIQAVMYEHDLSSCFLAAQPDCQVGERQVLKYRSGEAAVPMWFWTLLYKHTRDHRLLQLITGDINVIVVDLPEMDLKNNETIKHLVDTARSSSGVTCSLGDILADGVVDRNDRVNVAKLAEAAPEAIKAIARANHAIQSLYKKSKY